MPIRQRPDGSGEEIIQCQGKCPNSNFYCGPGCRNTRGIESSSQEKIKEIEDQMYFIGNIELREQYKKQIEGIIDPNTFHWKQLKEIEKNMY